MSFGKLLAAGKSWMGGDGIGRYRMQKNIRLPKFISPRNPFKAEVGEGAALTSAASSETPSAAVEVTTSAKAATGWSRVGGGVRRLVMFCQKHNPFSPMGSAPRSAIPRFGKPRVQGELSLDQVKVMRGDLAHADLEVVPAGSSGAQAANPAWKSLSARILGATHK